MESFDTIRPMQQSRRERRAGMAIIRRLIFKDHGRRSRNLVRRHFTSLS